MAGLTTAQLVTRCQARFTDPNGDIVTPAQWLDYLNDAYDDGNGYSPFWPWMEKRDITKTIAPGANSVVLDATGVWEVLSVFNITDNYPLTAMEQHGTYRGQYPFGAAAPGSPVNYRMFNSTLETFPYTDHTITLGIEFYQAPAQLVSGSVNPVWPDSFIGTLVDGALALAYTDDGNPKFADGASARFMSGLGKMEETLLSGTRGEFYPRVSDEWF